MDLLCFQHREQSREKNQLPSQQLRLNGISDIKSSIEINRPFAPVERTKNWT